jgi:hypothetical protein
MRKTQTKNVFLIWFSQDMLLSNDHFVAVLVDSLLLDDDHPRKAAGSFESVKAAVQRDAAEALQQLTVYPPGRAALLGDPTVAVRRETPLFAMPFIYKMHHFTKTGSGQT